MTAVFIAGAVAITVGDLWLVGVCWRQRAVLGGLLGAAGIPLVVFAFASGRGGSGARGALVIALLLLGVGAGLYGLGQRFERLLEEPRDRET
jgi:hypothetical protein